MSCSSAAGWVPATWWDPAAGTCTTVPSEPSVHTVGAGGSGRRVSWWGVGSCNRPSGTSNEEAGELFLVVLLKSSSTTQEGDVCHLVRRKRSLVRVVPQQAVDSCREGDHIEYSVACLRWGGGFVQGSTVATICCCIVQRDEAPRFRKARCRTEEKRSGWAGLYRLLAVGLAGRSYSRRKIL